VIEVLGLTKVYPPDTFALKEVSFAIPEGQFAVLIGPSGAGKSTLLRCLNGLVAPTAGEVLIDGESVTRARGDDLRRLRAKVGFVFQQFNLVKRLSVLDNVMIGRLARAPQIPSLVGWFPSRDLAAVEAALVRLRLGELTGRRVDSLSGGQQQRVAIARALVQEPRVILADEPMASLDPALARTVMDLLSQINQEDRITVLTSLHVMDLAVAYGQRVIGLRDGRVVYDGSATGLGPAEIKAIFGEAET